MSQENEFEAVADNLSPTLTPTLTDLDLSCSDFPEPRFLIPGLIPEGLSVLAGKPKTGKSLLAHNLCFSLATGRNALGTLPVNPCDVLYLALEESEGRLNSKLLKIRASNPPTNRIHLAFEWSRMDEGGLDDLTRWVQAHPSVRLIVIDTLTKIRPLNVSYGTLYAKDYTEISMLKKVADQHSVAIVVIHHLRKASAQDELDMITGSTGLTGAADSLLILKRQRASKEADLFISGRDLEEQNLALKFDPSSFSWTLLGQSEEYHMSKERQEILRVLESANGPLKLKDIARAVGKKEPVVHKHLASLIESGFVEQPGHGLYQIRKLSESSESGENGESLITPQ